MVLDMKNLSRIMSWHGCAHVNLRKYLQSSPCDRWEKCHAVDVTMQQEPDSASCSLSSRSIFTTHASEASEQHIRKSWLEEAPICIRCDFSAKTHTHNGTHVKMCTRAYMSLH